jgi:hypothetical protein
MANDFKDPGNLLSMEDGQSPDPWWESPDITVPLDQAQVGTNNVTVTGRKAAGTLTTAKVKIEAYIANPFLSAHPPSPTDPTSTAFIGQQIFNATDIGGAGAGTFTPPTITLTIPSSTSNPDDPVAIGHRCLIGQIMGFGGTVLDPFTPATEQHQCQHNISVVTVRMAKSEKQDAAGAGKGAAGVNREWPLFLNGQALLDFRVDTTTQGTKTEDVLVRATWMNLDPKTQRLARRLKQSGVFRGFARKPPAGFAYNVKLPLADLPHGKGQKPYIPKVLKVNDQTRGKKQPRYDAVIQLQPKRRARIALNANLEGASTAGLAHVFHLEQLNLNGKPQGGLTLVFVPMS